MLSMPPLSCVKAFLLNMLNRCLKLHNACSLFSFMLFTFSGVQLD